LNNKHSIIQIDGKKKFICRVDSKGLIVESFPHNTHLVNNMLSDVFEKGRKTAKFTFLRTIEPNLVLGEDKLKIMLEKNPKLNLLIETFDLELIS
jgi:hypothetical protein